MNRHRYDAPIEAYRPARAPAVLLVDDDEPIREALRLILEDEGYHVIEAANGLEALRVIRAAAEPLVVLLDLMMPKMNGAEVLRRITEEPHIAERHVFALLTAANRAKIASALRDSSDLEVTVLSKPIDITVLCEFVQTATAQRMEKSA